MGNGIQSFVHAHLLLGVNMSSRFSRNSEAYASELRGNLEMILRYHMDSNAFRRFKSYRDTVNLCLDIYSDFCL